MACDICGKPGRCQDLNGLLDWTLVGNMVICDSCASVADKLLNKYRDMAWKRCKKKLKSMQKRYRGNPHQPTTREEV